jgi:hypothetical protein
LPFKKMNSIYLGTNFWTNKQLWNQISDQWLHKQVHNN